MKAKDKNTDRVREYVSREYIEPARKRGESKVRIVAGDVHRSLGLHNRVPLVCSALRSREFLRRNHLRIEAQEGPPSMMSTTVTFTYVIDDQPQAKSDAELFYQLRGIAKRTFQDLGGAETFIQSERDAFNAGIAEREKA